MVAIRHFRFLKIRIFDGQYGRESQSALSCHISWCFVIPLLRYGDLLMLFVIFSIHYYVPGQKLDISKNNSPGLSKLK